MLWWSNDFIGRRSSSECVQLTQPRRSTRRGITPGSLYFVMKSTIRLGILVILLIAVFTAGTWYGSRSRIRAADPSVRKILYWHDPMHPAYKSDRPGIAPDCGMQLEPVYAGEAEEASPLPAGLVQISTDRQQIIGLKVATVQKTSESHNLRILGRVAPDETRTYRMNAATDGWVREITAVTTGCLVKKDDLLAKIYAPESFSAMKAYLYGLRSLDRFQTSGKETKEQIELTDANIENYRNGLRNLGMSEHQLDEIMRTRQGANVIEIRATEAGFILARNLSLGQRFEKGAELYRIADLRRVWILADVFENEEESFRPGTRATISHALRGRSLEARVGNVLPQFDPGTRTLKIRLEADNPGYALRPDMFVDVELPIQHPPALVIPSGAVLDTGLKKTVFVDRGNGYFDPRIVETGWRSGEKVEITRGLAKGERIVVSGNFLIDSESRLKLAASRVPEDNAVDPVCGMEVDPRKVENRVIEYCGKTYYFCSTLCRDKFRSEPEKYLENRGRQ
jgi:Cu(I)/Ag(I) efflux system membrane fusion protein